MRILACFDGSEAALAALGITRRLAAAINAEVHLVRVVPRNFAASGVSWSGSAAVDLEKHRKAQEEDRAFWRQLQVFADDFSVPVVVSILNGEQVANELAHYARIHAVDLIVVGCHQRRGPQRGVGGEVTTKLVEAGVAPVLLGPIVPVAPLNLAAVPRGCSVFSRDGFFLGDLVSSDTERIRIYRQNGQEIAVRAIDAWELSVASGLHLAFDLEDLDQHVLPLAMN